MAFSANLRTCVAVSRTAWPIFRRQLVPVGLLPRPLSSLASPFSNDLASTASHDATALPTSSRGSLGTTIMPNPIATALVVASSGINLAAAEKAPLTRASLRSFMADAVDRAGALDKSLTSPYSFDTYRMVKSLEVHGFTRSQAVLIMRAMHEMLGEAIRKVRHEMIVKADLDNETYLYKAALSELATELKMLRQNDHATLKSEIDSIMRELDSLSERSRDDISTIKSDILIDLNNRKSEIREEAKLMEMKIHEVNSKLTVMCSDIKTDIETMKFQSTKDVVLRLLMGCAVVLVVLSFTNSRKENIAVKPTKELAKEKRAAQSDDGLADTVIILDRAITRAKNG